MKIALIIALAFGLSEAGFRCETPLIGGDALCSAGCVVVGLGQHTSGICDDKGKISTQVSVTQLKYLYS